MATAKVDAPAIMGNQFSAFVQQATGDNSSVENQCGHLKYFSHGFSKMLKLMEIMFALLVPGLITSQVYKALVEKKILKSSLLNTTLALILTALISVSGLVVAVSSWESIWCLVRTCGPLGKQELEGDGKEAGSVTQKGGINQYNTGNGSNNAEIK